MSNIKVEMLSINNFDHICRTCSSEGELKSLFDNIETLSMLESFTQMQFSKTDELPNKICPTCLSKISECFHFINNCKIVDEGFRKCINEHSNQLEVKTDELHSSIDIKQEEEPPETAEAAKEDLVSEEAPYAESNENIKQIDVKQSEYYILKWGSSSESQENKQYQFTVVNNPSNEQDLIEKEALRRLQAANRMRKYRARHHATSDTPETSRRIPVFSLTNELADNTALRRASDPDEPHRRGSEPDESHRRGSEPDDTAHRRASEPDEPHRRDSEPDETAHRRGNARDESHRRDSDPDTARRRGNGATQGTVMEETHRARAHLTIPHEEHAALRRNYDTPERITLRRALAREQMRKYRSKLTAEETTEHRAQVSENMRRFRAKLHADDMDVERAHARELIRRFRAESTEGAAPKQLQVPLRLSDMAKSLLRPRDPLEMSPSEESRDLSRFSLRPTRIPQVKKQVYETRLHANENQQLTKFRSWKRHIETPDEVTIRLAKTALQMKRIYSSLKEPGLVEESALRRAKAAGQLRQYRPMLRKNKTTTGPASTN